jgi:hypothetical protein
MRSRAALVALAALILAAAPAEPRSLRAERWSTRIEVQPNGDLVVTEQTRFRFAGRAYSSVYRGLPRQRTDGLEIDSWSGTAAVQPKRRQVRVEWSFPATRDSVRDFSLVYRARRAVGGAPDGVRTLTWWAFPSDHDYRIDQADVTVVLPAAWRQRPESWRVWTRPHVVPRLTTEGFVFDVGSLRPDRSVRLSMEIDATLVAGGLPQWQLVRAGWRAQAPIAWAAAGAVLLAGCVLVLAMYRELLPADAGPRREHPSPEPPSDMPAALAGALRSGDLSAQHVVAGLLELAGRGHLRFEPETQPRLGGSKQVLQRRSVADSLAPWERILLGTVFQDADSSGRVRADKAWRRLHAGLGTLRSEVVRQLQQRGEFTPEAERGRQRLLRTGLVVLALIPVPLAALVPLWSRVGPHGLGVVLALGLVALAAFGASQALPRHTAVGRERAGAWAGFARTLHQRSKDPSPLEARRFEAWLPYAVGLGVGKGWIDAGKRWQLPAPGWLRDPSGAPLDLAFLGAVTASWTASIAASSSPGGSGGGSAGGGGSSGAR